MVEMFAEDFWMAPDRHMKFGLNLLLFFDIDNFICPTVSHIGVYSSVFMLADI